MSRTVRSCRTLCVIERQNTMKRIIIFILVFICNWSLGQEHRSLFQSKTIKHNKVYKIVEYNPEDSILFFEKYPDGYYSKYDKRGRMTESNGYSSYESAGVWHPNMFKNYYLYDSLDNQIAFVQIHDEMESPFRFLEVSSFSESDTIKIARLKESYQMNSEFIFEEKIKTNKSKPWGDTLKISKRHYFLKSITDSSITMDIYFDKKGMKDSTIFRAPAAGWIGKHISENITKYNYYQNGKVKSIIQNSYQIKNSLELYSVYEYYFLENELLDMLKSYYSTNNEWTVRKYKYFFRND